MHCDCYLAAQINMPMRCVQKEKAQEAKVAGGDFRNERESMKEQRKGSNSGKPKKRGIQQRDDLDECVVVSCGIVLQMGHLESCKTEHQMTQF